MQAVAGVAHGMDERHVERPVDLGPQPADMGLDDTGLGIEMKVPDAFQKHGAGDHAAFAAHLIEFAGHKYVIRIDGQQLTALVAAIQLACRNPNFRGPTRVLVEEIVHQLQRIAKRGAPDLDLIHDVLKFGWNSELDGSSINHG